MNAKIQAIEREAGEGKCFSRAHVGKLAFKKIGEMEELYQRGVFIDSLVVDPPVSHGEILSTPILVGESTAERIKEKIWACLLDDDDVRKIGVYGMGGIGKSTVMEHINNSLLKESNKFDYVIWVIVSKPFNVIQLQHDIARKLDLDLREVEHVKERAAKLKAKLEDKKRYVLILDDMWEAFPLEKVGIPEPTSSNGCKLVLTTRLLDVCLGMNCKNIKMELLSKEEAQNLFLDKLGRDVFNSPNLKAIAEEVLERCAQLPLAIVTIAGKAEVFKILEFSYERLKDEKLQQCLLHCALYPEDFKIEKPELIEHLIDEGIIERRNSRQAEFDRGYSMLNKLENACLLEGGIEENDKERFVKMHDLVRDMVLRVASPQFKVEGQLGLEDFSDEGKWGEDLVKASVDYLAIFSKVKAEEVASLKNLETFKGLFSDMYEFSTYIRSLEKGQLATYEIQVGKPLSLRAIWGKKVVLKNCNISRGEESFELPKDVHDLQIRRCKNLRCLCDVPSLNHATELKRISLRSCKGIEHILCSLSSSCTLSLQTPEILELRHLANLRGLFRKEKDASAQVPPHTFSRLKRIDVYQCGKLKKLLTPGLLLNLHNLEHINVSVCAQIREIIEEEEDEKEEEGMDTTKITLPKLKKLWLQSLPELKSICSSSKVISCDSLEEILIYRCPKLKRLPLTPPPSLKKIEADEEEWWESLEWDSQDTKNVLQPFFRKIRIGEQVKADIKYFRGVCEQGELHS
uniref:Uncharacterized protein n=1 Tax=Fagus sylvatica TaxID=28930 RepID=A0A2N9FDV0_FAGSY